MDWKQYMSIILTGDVHQMSLGSADQNYLKGTEVESAYKYTEIAEYYGVNVTLFFTGQSVDLEPDLCRKIVKKQNIELGGHTYYAYTPEILYTIYRKLFGTRHGPYLIQNWEVKKTINAIQNNLNYRIRSWRDHSYVYDKNTPAILLRNGIRYFSDIVGPNYHKAWKEKGNIYVPVNILPDHDYVFHGSQTKANLNVNNLVQPLFNKGGVSCEDWLINVKKSVKKIVNNNGVATILAHPACMEVCDDFKTFRKLCKYLQNYQTIIMRDLNL
ncbi:MAG TPA: hypothetical protein VE912_18345 [Bacteroidales bacterium]|nr:hypothetical protein [Bacteroidales bacterium]